MAKSWVEENTAAAVADITAADAGITRDRPISSRQFIFRVILIISTIVLLHLTLLSTFLPTVEFFLLANSLHCIRNEFFS